MKETFKEKFQNYWFAVSLTMLSGGLILVVVSAIIKMLFDAIMIEQVEWLVGIADLGLLLFFLPVLLLEFLLPSKILDLGRFGTKTTVVSRLLFIFLLPFVNYSFITILSKGLDIVVNGDHFLTDIYNSLSLHFYVAIGSYIALVALGFLTRLIIYLVNINKKEDPIRYLHINDETQDVDR
jgi:hypothetical protein